MVLATTLALSNGFWAYRLILANRPTPTPLDQQRAPYAKLSCDCKLLELADRAVLQSFAAIQASAVPGATRATIINAVRAPVRANQNICLEDPGVVNVGSIGLKFDNSGRLVGATKGFCPP